MSAQTKLRWPLAIALAATLGVVSGILVASFRFKLPKLMKGS